jgi:hypothetical protein
MAAWKANNSTVQRDLMSLLSEYHNELNGSYPVEKWKEECIFCSRAGNCGSEVSEFCPLVDEED